MFKIAWFLLLFIFFAKIIYSQEYNGDPCTTFANPLLKEELSKGYVSIFPLSDSYVDRFTKASTSFLGPKGDPPCSEELRDWYFPLLECSSLYYSDKENFKKDTTCQRLYKTYKKIIENENVENIVAKYDNWSCMFNAYSAIDNDTTTAWIEGEPGEGKGEILMVNIDVTNPVLIFAGYGKSKSLYYSHHRPKKVKIYVLEAKEKLPAQTGGHYSIITVLAQHETTLKDKYGFQSLNLPTFTVTPESKGTFLAIEILSAYKGTSFDNTCITEIKNR